MISENISEKSAVGMTQPANDIFSPSHSPVSDLFLESVPVHDIEQETIHLQPYVKGLSIPCSTQNTIPTELHCIEANLYKDEEISAFAADSQRHEKMDNGDRGIVENDHGKDDEDAGKFLCGVQKCIDTATEPLAGGKMNRAEKERNINTARTGVDKDLGKNKDLRAVLSGVENYHDKAEDMRTVFGSDIVTLHSGDEMDLGKDTKRKQYETTYEDEETTELNYLLFQPPEEFRVCST